MSVLTKVFTVLLSLSSIALSMLVVAAFSQQQKWKDSAQNLQATAAAESAKAKAVTANATIEQQRALDRHKKDLEEMGNLKTTIASLQGQVSDLQRDRADLGNKLSVEQGQATSLSDQNNLIQAALNREKEFSAKLAGRNSELERRNVDLNDRVKELTTNVEMARSQIRALQQQIASMEGSGQGGPVAGLTSARQIPGGPGIVEPGTPSVSAPVMAGISSPIRGEVKSVEANLASVSVGAADGVAPGMMFLIYRPGKDGSKPQYLGSMRITRVEANESAGVIEQSEGDIAVGDAIRDEVSLAKRG